MLRHVYCTVHSPDEFITWLDHEISPRPGGPPYAYTRASEQVLQVAFAAASWLPRRRRRNETRLAAASTRPLTRHTLAGIHLLSRLASASIDLFIDRQDNRPGRMRTACRMRRCSGERRLLSCEPPHRATPCRAVKRKSYPRHIDAP